jgi:uncharacterized protein YjbI with pentapeptide repeats
MRRVLTGVTLAFLFGAGPSLAFDPVDLELVQTSMRCIGCDLSNADLTGADLTIVYLQRANLADANLQSAFLSGADLTGAILTGADLTGATFCDTIMPDGTINNSDCPE